MPLTLPSHAAALLPIYRLFPRLCHPTALVAGCCAPDIAYIFGISGADSHSLTGAFLFCLPISALTFIWAEFLVLPFFRATLPAVLGVDWPRLLTTRGVPFGFAGVFLLIVPSLLGTGTHLLWDGLTHDKWWPASVLYPDVTFDLFGSGTELDRFLWWLSTLAGAAIVFAWALIRFKGPVRAKGGNVKWLATVVLLPLSAFALYLFNPYGSGSDYANTWVSLVTTARVCAAVLTVLCLLHKLSQRSAGKGLSVLSPEKQPGKREDVS